MTASIGFAALAIVGATTSAAAQRVSPAPWDSVSMEYRSFCQIGTCSGYHLTLSQDRRFTVRGVTGTTRRTMGDPRFGNVSDQIAMIVWSALPPSIPGARAATLCAEERDHQPSFIVELFSNDRAIRIVDPQGCGPARNPNDSDRMVVQSFKQLRLLEQILGTIPEAQAAQRPDPNAGPYRFATIAGCYALTLGEWSGPFPSGVPAAHQPPPNFRLLTTGADTAGDGTIYRSVTPNPAVFGRFLPEWGVHMSGPTIEVFWSTGFAGVRPSLWRYDGGGRLEGHATAFTDLEAGGVVQPTTSAKAVRVACGTE